MGGKGSEGHHIRDAKATSPAAGKTLPTGEYVARLSTPPARVIHTHNSCHPILVGFYSTPPIPRKRCKLSKSLDIPERCVTSARQNNIDFLTPHQTIGDHVAGYFIRALRVGFDIISMYRHKDIPPGSTMSLKELRAGGYSMSPDQWLNRILFLESTAAVPGMVAATCRHLRSLRLMRRDAGWIHTLLEEAGAYRSTFGSLILHSC